MFCLGAQRWETWLPAERPAPQRARGGVAQLPLGGAAREAVEAELRVGRHERAGGGLSEQEEQEEDLMGSHNSYNSYHNDSAYTDSWEGASHKCGNALSGGWLAFRSCF